MSDDCICPTHDNDWSWYSECPLRVAEERDRMRAACIKIFQHSENMIANVAQCDYRYYQGHMCAVEAVLKAAGYDHKGNRCQIAGAVK